MTPAILENLLWILLGVPITLLGEWLVKRSWRPLYRRFRTTLEFDGSRDPYVDALICSIDRKSQTLTVTNAGRASYSDLTLSNHSKQPTVDQISP